MNSLYLIIFCILGYATLIFGALRWKKSILYTVAIGSIVNANVFNALDYPISIGNLTFGMDSVIYVLFLFSILIMYVDFGKKDTLTLIWCSLGGVIFASVIQFLTSVASSGYSIEFLFDLLSYFANCISSYFAGITLMFVFDFFKKRNVNLYLNIFISIIIACIVESVIYFAIMLCLQIATPNIEFLTHIACLYLGKLVSIVFAMISLFFLKKFCNVDKQHIENE